MDLSGTVQAQNGWYLEDQLVVALAHLKQVQQQLTELGVEWKDPLESRELGLALLELTNLPPVAHELRSQARDTYPETDYDFAQRTVQERGSAVPNLDLVMSVIRRRSALTYRGWTITIGKNRIIRGIEGLPEIGGGAEGDPTPVNPKTFQLQRQAAGPRGRIQVGVLDTQLFAHPALEGTYIAAPDALLPDAVLHDPPVPFRAGHATFIAGVILQRAPGADLHVHGVLDTEHATAHAWDVATKMVEFVGSGIDILNLSFGCATDDGQPPLLLARAVDQLSPEIVLVAAAGNHGRPLATDASEPAPRRSDQPMLTPETPYWPAALDDVTAVGARSGADLAGFSPNLPWVDLTAPGVDLASTYLFGRVDITHRSQDGLGGSITENFDEGFARWSGTSFAAAYVTGEIAAFARRGQRTAREALDLLLQRAPKDPEEGSKPFHLET